MSDFIRARSDEHKEERLSQIKEATAELFASCPYSEIMLTTIVERPLKDEKGELVLKNGKKQSDSSLRDTENVPLKDDITEYFKREVLPFAPDAWIDEKKNVVGYEIPFTRYFYKYEAPKPSAQIMDEIKELEKDLAGSLTEIFGE